MIVTYTENPIYLNSSVSVSERAKDLVDRLTLEEKVGLMSHPANGIPRLNIPQYNYWSEALHGIARKWKRNGVSAGHRHGRHLGQEFDPPGCLCHQ